MNASHRLFSYFGKKQEEEVQKVIASSKLTPVVSPRCRSLASSLAASLIRINPFDVTGL